MTETNDSLDRLIQALRSPLPDDFQWNFEYVRTCAFELVRRLGLYQPDIDQAIGNPSWFDHPFRAIENDGLVVPLYGVRAADVTPAMVADKLEELRALRPT